MSDEESFVILGSTPTTSMENYNSLLREPYATVMKTTTNKDNNLEIKIDVKSDHDVQSSNLNLDAKNLMENLNSMDLEDIKNSIVINKNDLNLSSQTDANKEKNENEKLTSQFQLGLIESKNSAMMASIYSYLPSLTSGCIDNADLEKIQYIVSEHHQLKENLEKTNVAMRQHFSMIQLWQNTFKSHAQTANEKLIALQHLNETLKNENDALKQENEKLNNTLKQQNEEFNKTLNENKEILATNVECMKHDNNELIRNLSEKDAIIRNLASELDKKEKQMSGYEFVSATYHDAEKDQKMIDDNAALKASLEKCMADNSLLLAENMEIKNMKQVYLDEITCLKVNITAAEELNKKLYVDINALKMTKLDYEKTIALLNKTINGKTEEMNLLKTQLDVFCHDFQMERQAREELAGQKEQLLSDLKLLQKRNEDLTKNQYRLSTSSQNVPTPPSVNIINNYRNNASAPTPAVFGESSECASNVPQISNFARNEEQIYTSHKFTCPICSKTFKQLSTLQDHVQDCLDDTTPKHPSHNYLMMNFD